MDKKLVDYLMFFFYLHRNAETSLSTRDTLTSDQLSQGIALALKVSEFLEEMV